MVSLSAVSPLPFNFNFGLARSIAGNEGIRSCHRHRSLLSVRPAVWSWTKRRLRRGGLPKLIGTGLEVLVFGGSFGPGTEEAGETPRPFCLQVIARNKPALAYTEPLRLPNASMQRFGCTLVLLVGTTVTFP